MIQAKRKIKIWAIIGLMVVSGIGFFGFKKGDEFQIAKHMDIYFTLFRELNLFYVDDVAPEKLMETSIDAMLESLDPYTEYIPEREMEDFKFQTTGEYGGIGALIRMKEGVPVIAQPYKNFPADKGGLWPGDRILEVDGKSTKGMPLEKVSENLKGAPNTTIELKIARPYLDETFKKELIRKEVKIPSVPYFGMVDDGIGFIHMSRFTTDCAKEVKEALKALKRDGAQKIILDLRGNPGGLLNEAVELANVFVPRGKEIVSTRGKIKQFDKTYVTENFPVDVEIPLVVMVNRGSASASEIVAGSIQDYDRGVILGQRTFGKGLVQTTRPLSYNGQLKVTTAKYYIPSGRCIQALDYSNRNEDGSVGHIPDSLISEFQTANGRKVYDGGGINPDIKVEQESLSKLAISLLAKDLYFEFATKYRAEHPQIVAATEFSLSDSDMEAFKVYLSDKDFDYETRTEKQLKELIESAKDEKYYERAKETFEALNAELSHDKYEDLESFKDEIMQLLKEEIVGRYYYQEGMIKCALQHDNQLEAAIELLKNETRYQKILAGNK